MAKKNRPEKTVKGGDAGEIRAPLSRPALLVICAGGCAVLLGFLALTRVDPLGRNAFSLVSPALILGGYACVGLGLALP